MAGQQVAAAVGREQALRQLATDSALRLTGMLIRMRAELDRAQRDQADPDVLDRLYVIDSLACRARARVDNLLLLAEQSASEDPDDQVTTLVDVIEAALGRIDGWARVTVGVVDTIAVIPAISGYLIRIMTELLDNACRYTAASAPIAVSAHLLRGGGAQLRVENAGYDIPPDRLARYNQMLRSQDQTLEAGPKGSIQQGLQVVRRAAQQAGVDVSLVSRVPRGGTIAVVDVPVSLLTEIASSAEDAPLVLHRPRPAPRPVSGRAAIPQQTSSGEAMPVRIPQSLRDDDLAMPTAGGRPAARPPVSSDLAADLAQYADFDNAFRRDK